MAEARADQLGSEHVADAAGRQYPAVAQQQGMGRAGGQFLEMMRHEHGSQAWLLLAQFVNAGQELLAAG